MKNFRPKYLKLISIMLTSLITMQTCIAIESPEWLNNLKITIADSYFNHPKTTIAVAATGSLAVISAGAYASKKLLTKPVKLSNFEKIKRAICSKNSLYAAASIVGIAGVAGLLFWYFKKPKPVIPEPVIPEPVIPEPVIIPKPVIPEPVVTLIPQAPVVTLIPQAPVVKKTYIQRPLSIPELPTEQINAPEKHIPQEQQIQYKEISITGQKSSYTYLSFFKKNNQEFVSINMPENLFEILQKNDSLKNLLLNKTEEKNNIHYVKNNGIVSIVMPKNKFDIFLEINNKLKFFALEYKKTEPNISYQAQINLNNTGKNQKSIEETNKEMADKAIQNLKKTYENKQIALKVIQNLFNHKPITPSKNNRPSLTEDQEEARKKRALKKVENVGTKTLLALILTGSQSAPTPERCSKKTNPLEYSEI